MFNSDLDALVPMLCVTLTALATMGTEAFRGRNERLPIGWWGLIGLGGAALSAGLLWNRNVEGFGVIVADNFGLFVTFILVAVGALTIMFSSQVVYRDDIPAAADAPTLDELLSKISAMALDVLPDNHPGVDPASLYLQITALREAEPAVA